MKRYRVLNIDYDSRATILSMEIHAEWEPHVRELNHRNQINTIAGVLGEFGTFDAETKIQNLIDLGSAPFSVLAFHNKFLRQLRVSFVSGAYYPALTGACALGERILNHLVLRLRDFFKTSVEYKRVYDKKTFDNWGLAIDTLEAWDVLLPDVATAYRLLADIRNRKAIHFNPETEENDREFALEAIKILSEIIRAQFSAFGSEPWFIPNIPGKSFIRKDAERLPFIQVVYIPNSVQVGPYHELDFKQTDTGLVCHVSDDYSYEHCEISDEEFAQLVKNGPPPAPAP